MRRLLRASAIFNRHNLLLTAVSPSVPHIPKEDLKSSNQLCLKAQDILQAKYVAMRTTLHNATRALEGANNKLAKVHNTTRALEGATNELAKLTK